MQKCVAISVCARYTRRMDFDKKVAREKMDRAVSLLKQGLRAFEEFEEYVKPDDPQAANVQKAIRGIALIYEIKLFEHGFKNPEP